MVVKVIEEDENGDLVEVLRDLNDAMLFGTIPEEGDADRENNSSV